jgi:hypothetical protein
VEVHGPRYDWSTRDEAGTVGTPVLFRPGHPALVVAGPLEATNVYLTAGLLQKVADMVYGTEQTVAFASSRPVGSALGCYWSGLARWARETVASGAFGEPLVRADLTRRLAVGMLECFPLTGDRERPGTRSGRQPRGGGSPTRADSPRPTDPPTAAAHAGLSTAEVSDPTIGAGRPARTRQRAVEEACLVTGSVSGRPRCCGSRPGTPATPRASR